VVAGAVIVTVVIVVVVAVLWEGQEAKAPARGILL